MRREPLDVLLARAHTSPRVRAAFGVRDGYQEKPRAAVENSDYHQGHAEGTKLIEREERGPRVVH